MKRPLTEAEIIEYYRHRIGLIDMHLQIIKGDANVTLVQVGEMLNLMDRFCRDMRIDPKDWSLDDE
jgi:hypothetical protein